jgi:hypothetical protein
MKTISLFHVFLLTSSIARTQSIYVVSPLALGNIEANGPFLVDQRLASSFRYQQVYAASDFARIGSPMLITELRFDPSEGSVFSIDVNLENIRIDFSTTTSVPDGLSAMFAENVGADNTVAFSGPLRFFDTAVETFGVHIPLQTPFFYDPSRGNLLMDVRNYVTIPAKPFGYPLLIAEGTLNDSVSTVAAFDVNSPNAPFSGTGGLVTAFTVTPIPEPSTVSLLIICITALGRAVWKRSSIRTAGCRVAPQAPHKTRIYHGVD